MNLERGGKEMFGVIPWILIAILILTFGFGIYYYKYKVEGKSYGLSHTVYIIGIIFLAYPTKAFELDMQTQFLLVQTVL